MSDASPFDAFPDLCSPDDHSQFDIVQGSSDFRNGLPRIDTKAFGPPRLSIVSNSSTTTTSARLHVITPPGTLFPSNTQYPAFLPSAAANGSSDEGSLLQILMTTRFAAIYSIDVHVAEGEWMQEGAQTSEHIIKWKAIRDQATIATGTTTYIPQSIYQPYTEADRIRYIEKADLKEPIIFKTAHPDQWGVALEDAMRAKMKNLIDKDDNMFENCGPSVSIRLQWPGYRAWKKQILTTNFKSPKGLITRAKLAKTIAICVKRFVEDKEKERMVMEADRRWRVGPRYIRVEDLILVSLHHISKGSWQPQLRLRTPLSDIQLRRLQAQAPPSVAF
ncbi:hypothetical protein BDR07DRAFT_1479693 [Suillus spraguei]|nr:hypothetical protein BDR07DRAFT_1479693 [Suillus spraguei]